MYDSDCRRPAVLTRVCVASFIVALFSGNGLAAARASSSLASAEQKQIIECVKEYVRLHPLPVVNEMENEGIWTEQTAPVLHIQGVSRGPHNTRIVNGCAFSPTLLYPGATITAVVTGTSRGWEVLSLKSFGYCTPLP